MKRKNKLLVLSLTSLLGLGLMSCDILKPIPTNEVEEPEVIQDEVTTNDQLGTMIRLNEAGDAVPAEVKMANGVGYQIVEESNEKMSIRLFAAIDSYKPVVSAKVTSKVVSYRDDKAVAGENEQVIKAEQEFAITSVYSSLASGQNINWTETISAAEFPKPYYMVYTLNNIPADHWFDTISVSFSATGANEAKKDFVFNAMGLHGDYASNINYTVATDGVSYNAFKKTTGYQEKIILPAKHVEVTDFYAKPLGDIVALNPASTTGVFESWSRLKEVHLPNTLTRLGGYALAATNLKKVNIPVNVTETSSNLFGTSGVKLEVLDFEAKALVNANEFSVTAEVVNIPAGIESLPNKFFKPGYGPTKVVFGGTEAQWAALKTDANANNGFFIENVYCSDTTTSTITYHYGNGKIGSVTGDVETTQINGKLLQNPGNPIPNEEGMEFKGWFLDPEFTIPADFSVAVSESLNLYAKYGEFGPGISLADPLILNPNSPASFSVNLVPGKKAEFMKFEMPADATADWFYLTIDRDSSLVASSVSSTTSTNYGITVYDANQNEISLGSNAITDSKVAQKINSNNYMVRFYAQPGDVFYFKAMMNTGASYSVYGTMALNLNSYAHDSANEALPLTLGGLHADVNVTNKYEKVVYKYEATETKTVSINKDQVGNAYGGFVVVDAADPTKSLGSYSKSSAGFVLLDAVAGHTYLIEANASDVPSETSFVTIFVDEAPAGSIEGSPIELELGVETTVGAIAPQYVYYTFTIAEDSSVRIDLTGGSNYVAKAFELKNAADEVVASGTEDGKETSDGWGGTEISYGGRIARTVALTAGTYRLKVGYASTLSSWSDFKLKASLVLPGDEAGVAIAKTISLTDANEFESTVAGKWYSFVADADDFLVFNLASGASGMKVAFYNATGADKLKEITSVGGEMALKTTSGTTYLVYVYGAAGTATINASRAASVETGEAKDEAFNVNLGMANLRDVSANAGNSVWLKFTTTDAGVYKIFTRSFLNGAPATGNGNDASSSGLYTLDGTSPLTAKVNNGDDRNAHPETAGRYDAYAEYNLAANTTYYVKLNVGRTSAANWDVVKFGVKALETGDTSDMPDTTMNLSGDSFTAKASATGYWYKVSVAATDYLAINPTGLEGAVVSVYKADATTLLGSVKVGDAAPLKVLLGVADYFVKVSGADGDVALALTHEVPPSTVISNQKGTGGSDEAIASVDTKGEAGWINSDSGTENEMMSNVAGLNSGVAIYKVTVTVAGNVSFSWASTGESNYDYFRIYVDGVEKANGKSAAVVEAYENLTFHDYSIDLAAGQSISLIYRKDSSGNKGLDRAYVRNFTFTPAA